VHEPTDVSGELLGFGTGPHHAIVERVQEAPFRNPAPLPHRLLVHDRDLTRRPAEADEAEFEPEPERFAE